jgi:hypothetical protein
MWWMNTNRYVSEIGKNLEYTVIEVMKELAQRPYSVRIQVLPLKNVLCKSFLLYTVNELNRRHLIINLSKCSGGKRKYSPQQQERQPCRWFRSGPSSGGSCGEAFSYTASNLKRNNIGLKNQLVIQPYPPPKKNKINRAMWYFNTLVFF